MTSTIPTGSVVVGFDGSAWADLALDWAGRQASLQGLPLVLLNSVHLASPDAMDVVASSGGTPYQGLLAELEKEADKLLGRAARRVTEMHDLADVHQVVQVADPREALFAASKSASMVVVGSRGLGPIRELLLGSVSLAMTKHSSCPVVVLRPDRQRTHQSGILVGLAGDERDGPVLDFAFAVAAARELPVTIVHCFWDVVRAPDGAREVSDDESGYDKERALVVAAGRSMSERYPDVEVRHVLSRGFTDVQLIDSSRDAELIVLGHSRKPFLTEFMYGSVAPRVVEHAHCPAAVVPVGEEIEVPSPSASRGSSLR